MEEPRLWSLSLRKRKNELENFPLPLDFEGGVSWRFSEQHIHRSAPKPRRSTSNKFAMIFGDESVMALYIWTISQHRELQMDSLDSTSFPSIVIINYFHHPFFPSHSAPSDRIWIGITSNLFS